MMIIQILVLSLQLELNDLIYEKGPRTLPSAGTILGNGWLHYNYGPSLEGSLAQEEVGKTHELPWMGLLLTVCHSDDPASREYM